MPKRYLITSALLYANGPLHLGHLAGAYLPADAFARFQRLKGSNVLYVCGSDEYGVAITLSAEKEGRSPKEHVDYYHKINKALFEKLDFSFDNYSRTTWSGHAETTLEFFKSLSEKDLIEKKVCYQLYSQIEKRFLADRYVVGTCPKCGFENARGDECTKCSASFEATDLKNPKSSLSGDPLVLKETTHWFLRFDALKDKLSSWLNKKEWKPNVKHFAKNYIKDLKPRSITRDLDWGIPVPLEDAKGKVFYVWFDAPIGYISATREWALKEGNPDLWKKYWLEPETELVHFIGKDNIPFHAIFFPAMLMGQKEPYITVDELPANEFLNLEGRQFSKSDNWTIDMEEMLSNFSSDQVRYATLANAPESSDAEFTWKGFQTRCNSDLVGKYGNLVNRVFTFCHKWTSGLVPQHHLDSEDSLFLKEAKTLVQAIATSYESFRLRAACSHLMELATLANTYFDHRKPWADAKSPENILRMQTTLYACLEVIKMLALASSPIIPTSANIVWKMLGFESSVHKAHWDTVIEAPLETHTKLTKPQILFQKVEDSMIEQEIDKLHQNGAKANSVSSSQPQPKETACMDTAIDFKEFQKMDLRVGKVLSAEKIEKSQKLLLLQVDLAEEAPRQIVSGIAEHISCDELIGKSVVIVANLKPAKIMGVKSFGMLLCGDREDGSVQVAFIEGMSPGTRLA